MNTNQIFLLVGLLLVNVFAILAWLKCDFSDRWPHASNAAKAAAFCLDAALAIIVFLSLFVLAHAFAYGENLS